MFNAIAQHAHGSNFVAQNRIALCNLVGCLRIADAVLLNLVFQLAQQFQSLSVFVGYRSAECLADLRV